MQRSEPTSSLAWINSTDDEILNKTEIIRNITEKQSSLELLMDQKMFLQNRKIVWWLPFNFYYQTIIPYNDIQEEQFVIVHEIC